MSGKRAQRAPERSEYPGSVAWIISDAGHRWTACYPGAKPSLTTALHEDDDGRPGRFPRAALSAHIFSDLAGAGGHVSRPCASSASSDSKSVTTTDLACPCGVF